MKREQRKEAKQEICWRCGGAGKVAGIKYFGRQLEETCPTCGGAGTAEPQLADDYDLCNRFDVAPEETEAESSSVGQDVDC